MNAVDVFRWGIVVAFAFQAAFVVVYLRRPWRSTETGRALMTKAAALCLFLGLVIWNWYVVPLPLWVWPAFVWLVFVPAVGRQMWVLLRASRYSAGDL